MGLPLPGCRMAVVDDDGNEVETGSVGHIVKAFVVLRPGTDAGPSLTEEIVDLVKTRVGRHQYPREVEVVRELPKTETGKIHRFVLRQRRAGPPSEASDERIET